MDKRFPNESDAYRAARTKLMQAEIALRNQVQEVTASGLVNDIMALAMFRDGVFLVGMLEGVPD